MLMIAAALCMAFYSVWSRALAKQYGAIAYTALAMTFGALVLVVLAWMRGGFAATESFGPIQWSDVGSSAYSVGPSRSCCGRTPWSERHRHGSPSR